MLEVQNWANLNATFNVHSCSPHLPTFWTSKFKKKAKRKNVDTWKMCISNVFSIYTYKKCHTITKSICHRKSMQMQVENFPIVKRIVEHVIGKVRIQWQILTIYSYYDICDNAHYKVLFLILICG